MVVTNDPLKYTHPPQLVQEFQIKPAHQLGMQRVIKAIFELYEDERSAPDIKIVTSGKEGTTLRVRSLTGRDRTKLFRAIAPFAA